MSLTRREILEQLARLGIKTLGGLKNGCREYEAYWSNILRRPAPSLVTAQDDSFIPET